MSFSLYDCRGLIAFSLQNWIRPLSQIIVYELFDRCSRAVYAEMQCIISFGNISLQCVEREKIEISIVEMGFSVIGNSCFIKEFQLSFASTCTTKLELKLENK